MKTSNLYLIGNKELNYYKIGFSHNPEKRIREFNLPFEIEVLAVIPTRSAFVALWAEQNLHQYYRHNRLRGEWFRDISPSNFRRKAEKEVEAIDKKSGGL